MGYWKSQRDRREDEDLDKNESRPPKKEPRRVIIREPSEQEKKNEELRNHWVQTYIDKGSY